MTHTLTHNSISQWTHRTQPVWAGNPAPLFNSILERLPVNKQVEVVMVSASGKSSCREKVEEKIKAKNCKLVSFSNVKM